MECKRRLRNLDSPFLLLKGKAFKGPTGAAIEWIYFAHSYRIRLRHAWILCPPNRLSSRVLDRVRLSEWRFRESCFPKADSQLCHVIWSAPADDL